MEQEAVLERNARFGPLETVSEKEDSEFALPHNVKL
jgi:hypothetical protein